MVGMIGSLTESGRTSTDHRTQVNLKGQAFKTFKFNNDNTLQPIHQATVISEKNIGGDVGVYGNDAFGIYGVAKYGTTANQSFVLGLGILGLNALGDKSSEFAITRIVPPNDRFQEDFLGLYFINTSETTATIGTEVWV
jgi:hypothetical protein